MEAKVVTVGFMQWDGTIEVTVQQQHPSRATIVAPSGPPFQFALNFSAETFNIV